MSTLYDAYGRPLNKGILTTEISGVTTTGVRSVLSGHPAQNLNPVRLARHLHAAEFGDATAYLELAEEVEEKDLHYRSVLSTRKTQVAGLEITVEAASDSAPDIKAADLVRDFVSTNSLRQCLFDVLDAVGKGYSASEILWDCEGKIWMPSRIVWRDPRWFGFDPLDMVTLKLRGETGQLTDLAPGKFVLHIHKSKSGLPLRGGLARAALWPYLFKNFDLKAWVIFCEVYGHPLRVGKYGANASESDKTTLLRAVRNIASDHAAIIPESMLIEFIDAKAQGNAQIFERLAEYLDRQMSKLVLGQTGTTDTGSRVGTADAHEHVRQDIEASDAMQLAATLGRDLVRPLVDLNLGPQKRYPRLRIFRPESEDITALVSNVAKLVPLGLRVESSVLADKLGLPDPDDGAVCLEAVGVTVPVASDARLPVDHDEKDVTHSGKAAASLQEQRLPPPFQTVAKRESDSIDLYIDEALGGWEPLVEPLVNPVEELLQSCTNFEEFEARLSEVLSGQNATSLARSLALALFVARQEAEGGQ